MSRVPLASDIHPTVVNTEHDEFGIGEAIEDDVLFVRERPQTGANLVPASTHLGELGKAQRCGIDRRGIGVSLL
jgi:hypothetical protein